MAAHREVESLVLDKDTMHYKDTLALKYANWSITVCGSRHA